MRYFFLIFIFALISCSTLTDSERIELIEEYSLLYTDLSNLNTYGYKSYTDSTLFDGCKATPAISSYYGAYLYTQNPAHFAIVGDGFFKVRLENDEAGYTRNGQFKIDTDGNLVNEQGYPFYENINLGENYIKDTLRVTSDGVVYITVDNAGRKTQKRAGQILVYMVPPGSLVHYDNGVYVIKDGLSYNEKNELYYYQDGERNKIFIFYGFLEASNCSVVDITLRMREILSLADRETIKRRFYKRRILERTPHLFSHNWENTQKRSEYIEKYLPKLEL